MLDLLGEAMPPRVRVLVDGSGDLVLDYALRAPMVGSVHEGSRVRVPLRGREPTGTVVRVLEADAAAVTGLRYVLELLELEVSLTPGLMRVASWISGYYYASFEAVVKSLLPAGIRAQEKEVQRVALRRVELEEWQQLAQAGKLAEAELEGLGEDGKALLDEAGAPAALGRAKRQRALWLRLGKLADGEPMTVVKLGKEGFSRAVCDGLVERGWARQVLLVVERDPFADRQVVASAPHELNGEQARALAALVEQIEAPKPKPVLLFGVTGSGKTEVFLQAAQRVLDLGKQVLVLVPEIALTPQTVERFKARFAEREQRVAVLHSHLSRGERDDQWRRIRRGEADVVIGARSAVFAPLDRLGLIVVDEEHESSYKQDQAPRYQGRDVAVMRGHVERCAVLLGSATPSLESWRNVQLEKYVMVELRQRVDSSAMPLVKVLDMKVEAERVEAKGPAIFSEPLRQAMERRFEAGEQVILFLNRRGYSRALQCPDCGEAVCCKHCDLTLTYHRTEEVLLCHLCGYRQLPPKRCPECGDAGIALMGFGTQRVEETLRRVFPGVRSARIDADAMARKHALRMTLDEFAMGKVQVLIGTQMIAKGLHVPNVTLVGILNADLGLHAPDLRASERVFQLMVQVSGRAGRGDLAGEVMVQSYVPHAPAIQYARHGDVEGFMEAELEWRKMAGHPPFSRMVLLATRSPKEELGLFALENLAKRLREAMPEVVMVGDPVPSPLARAQDLYRAQLVLRGPSVASMAMPLREVVDATPMPQEVHLIVDVDPYGFG